MDPRYCRHNETATGHMIRDDGQTTDAEVYCVDCGLVLSVNGVPA